MNTTSRFGLTAFAVLALAGAAFGQVVEGVVVTNPRVGDNEFFSPNTIVSVDVPDGLVATAGMTNGDPLSAFIIGLDSAGNALTGATAVNLVVATVYDDAAGNSVQLDFPGTGIPASFFNTAGVESFRILFTTAGAGAVGTNAVRTEFDAVDESVDENLELDQTAPRITQALLSSDGNTLYLVYSKSLNNNDPNNDDNQTVLASVDATDFQFNTTNSFDNATGNPPAPFNVGGAFLDANGTIIQIDITGNGTIGPATFIRGAADNDGNPVGAQDIFDIVGNQAFQQDGSGNAVTTGVQIATVAPLTITSVEFFETVTFVDPAKNAVRVTYNLPLDPADLGDFGAGGFYGEFLQLGGVDSDLEITGVSIDPDNPNAVLLEVDAPGVDPSFIVFADGRASAGGQFSLVTDLGGDVPSSIFDPNDYVTAQTLTIADAIAPSAGGFSFHDLSGDGVLDAVAVFFDEPVTFSAAGSFTLNVVGAETLSPIALLQDDGTFPGMLPSSSAGTITPGSGTLGSVRVGTGLPDRLSTNNAFVLPFDASTYDWSGDGVGVNRPGTDGPTGLLTLDHPDVTATDGSGNETTVAAATAAVNTDRAAPVLASVFFFNGENQLADNNTQYAVEQNLTVGQQTANRRAALVFGETVVSGGLDPQDILAAGQGFDDLLGAPATQNNIVTVADPDAGTGYGPGSVVSFAAGIDLADGADNPASDAGGVAAAQRTAPYIAKQEQGGVVDSAFLIDDNNNGNADRIFIQFTEAIVQSLIETDGSQFSIVAGAPGATIDSADTLSGGDDTVLVLVLGGSSVAMSASVTIQYDGTIGDPIEGATTGNAVSPVATASNQFVAEALPDNTPVQDVATHLFEITVIDTDGSPADLGTRVIGAVALPTVSGVTADHNNIVFTYDITDPIYGGTSRVVHSVESWTNFLLGLRSSIYLHRLSNNDQIYDNTKFLDVNDDGNVDSIITGDSIQLTLSGSGLTNLRFQGVGEVSSNRVRNGTLNITWDFYRSNDGTLASFFQDGYQLGGNIIRTEGVVDSPDGTVSLAVSAPTSFFGNASANLSGIDRPIIFIVQRTDGTRYAVSSLYTSATSGRSAILFNPNQRRQASSGSNNIAPTPTQVTFDLRNVGSAAIPDRGTSGSNWTMVPVDRNGGYATASNQLPTLPTGVNSANIVTGTRPFAGALDSWVYWGDTNADGVWDFNESVNSMTIDANRINHFAFNMTTRGVQVGSGITSVVGGYGVGFFNNTNSNFGAQFHGSQLQQNAIFAANPINSGNRGATQGWLLATATVDVTASNFFAAGFNAAADFLIAFRGGNVGWVDATTATPDDFNVIEIEAPEALFIHYRN